MRCQTVRMPDGTAMIVCGVRAPRAARCQAAGCSRTHVALCDHPMGNGKTCDMRLCGSHRVQLGPEDDRCEDHAGQMLLFFASEKG